MCDCIKKVTEKAFSNLSEQFKNLNKRLLPIDYDEGLSGSTALTLTDELGVDTQRMYSKFEFRTISKNKKGEEGGSKKNAINLFYTFCPFCGVKYKTESDVKEEEKEAVNEK